MPHLLKSGSARGRVRVRVRAFMCVCVFEIKDYWCVI